MSIATHDPQRLARTVFPMRDTTRTWAHLPLPLLAITVSMIVGAAAFVAVSAAQERPGADIGAGLVLLWLMALGLPWSVLALMFFDDTTTVPALICWPALALLNLLIADVILGRLFGRRSAGDT